MPIGVLVGLGALAVIGGVIVARVLANRAGAEPADEPAAPASEPPAADSPLAVRPVLDDPFDAPVRAPDVGFDVAPPDPELVDDPEIEHAPLSRGDGSLREHHRSPSGHLRILFAKEIDQPADGEE